MVHTVNRRGLCFGHPWPTVTVLAFKWTVVRRLRTAGSRQQEMRGLPGQEIIPRYSNSRYYKTFYTTHSPPVGKLVLQSFRQISAFCNDHRTGLFGCTLFDFFTWKRLL